MEEGGTNTRLRREVVRAGKIFLITLSCSSGNALLWIAERACSGVLEAKSEFKDPNVFQKGYNSGQKKFGH